MRKRATGLTSIPIPDVPGSENVEIKDIESEDAEAANHGGFNQMEPSNFAKDLEMVKKMRKKASKIFTEIDGVKSAALRLGVELKSDDPQRLFKDFISEIVLVRDVYWGPGDYPADTTSETKTGIANFWENMWENDLTVNKNGYKDYLYHNVDREFFETIGKATATGAGVGAGAGALIGGVGAVPGALIGGALGLIGGLASQWNDEEIEKIEDLYNALVKYKIFYNKQMKDISSIKDPTKSGEDIVLKSESKRKNQDLVKSANNIFNITKVSKDMKNELIKLNAALNGLGYKNLIKTAAQVTFKGTGWAQGYEEIVFAIEQGVSAMKSLDGIGQIQNPPFNSENLLFDDSWNPKTYLRGVATTFFDTYDYVTGLNMYDSTKSKNKAQLVLKITNLIDSQLGDAEDVATHIEDNILAKGDNTGTWTGTMDDSASYALTALVIPLSKYVQFAKTYKEAVAAEAEAKKKEESEKSATITGSADTDNSRKWVGWLVNNNKIGNVYYDKDNEIYYTIEKKDEVMIWDGVREKEKARYKAFENPNEFSNTLGDIFNNEKFPQYNYDEKKEGSFKSSFIKKIAGPPPKPQGGGTGSTGSTGSGRSTGSGSGSGTKSASSKVQNWNDYINNPDPNDKASSPDDRRKLAKKWIELTKDNDFEDDLKNKYTYDYLSYNKWWKNNQNIPPLTETDVAGTTRAIEELIEAKKTAGGAGIDADTSKNATYIKYLTKPFSRGELAARDALFGTIKASVSAAIKGPGGPTGDQFWMDANYAGALLADPLWKKEVAKSYDTDNATKSRLLDTILSGTPDPDLSAAPGASGGAVSPQQIPQQSGVTQKIQTPNGYSNAVSIGTWGSDQIYLDIDSLRQGAVPSLYRLDNKTGKFAPLSMDQSGQWRSRLGPREIDRMARAVLNSRAVTPDRIGAFKEYMTTVRQNTGFPGFLRSLIGKRKSKDELEGLRQASTRQSRLDNLRKKGVI